MLTDLQLAFGYEEKRRRLPFIHAVGVESSQGLTSGGTYTEYKTPIDIEGSQETVSRENADWSALNYLTKRYRREGKAVPASWQRLDAGADFQTIKHKYSHTHPWVKVPAVDVLGSRLRYTGPLFAMTHAVGPTSAYWPKPPTDLLTQMIGKGATAIAKVAPTSPVANSAQIIGELREGLPKVPLWSLIGKKGNVAKKFADEYLNLEFGVKPAVSDLRKVSDAVRQSSKIIKQLERDSGRLVRRRYDFPVETSTTRTLVGTSQYPSPALNSWLYSSGGTLYKERTVTSRFWFSGAFTYHYDLGHDLRSKMAAAEQSANRLFGTRLTPELLWELAPWSWAVDWVSNFGDVFHNMSLFAQDGLVMPYGYVMCHHITTDTYTLHNVAFRGGGVQTFTQSFTTEVKKRVKATPYGFGLDPAAFNPRQWAILSALGITRAVR